ncbi:hypothetical protein [Desulfocurvus sp. DL9XJH121]
MSGEGLRFYKLSPGGNTTILVMDAEGFTPERRAALAVELMDPLHLSAEQVGFVRLDGPLPRLDMMGGEFCGNAARCLGAVLALEGRLRGESEISVSGVPEPLRVLVRGASGVFEAAVSMPVRPDAGCVRDMAPGIRAVALDGITHLLLDREEHPFPRDPVAEAARLRRAHGLDAEDAVGCVWHGRDEDGPGIRPVVWVRDTDSTYLETACGSGTMALALHLALASGGPVDESVLQPSGGRIRASVCFDPASGRFSGAWIGGPVRVVAQGRAFVAGERARSGA